MTTKTGTTTTGATDSTPFAQRWPALVPVTRTTRVRVRSALARRLFVSAVSRLDVTVRLHEPSGVRTLGKGGPTMDVHRPREFFDRLGRDAMIGFGESYMTSAWDSEDLGAFLTVLAARVADLVPAPLQRLRALAVRRPPRNERGDQGDTRRVIGHHYDLSNDLFALFLDSTMTYSAGRFDLDADGLPVVGGDLEASQNRKIDDLLDLADVGEGTRVLEIGSGWGALAIRAAKRGARVRTITLSTEQQALARQRIADAGLSEHVEVELCDYREVSGEYDAVVSVEMIEAVGWRHWTTYFATIDRVLAPGGRVAIQGITMPHDRMLATRHTHTWITTYIFPGGFLPSLTALADTTAEHTTLRLTEATSIGPHYAETLRQWDDSFLARADEVAALGFDETFCRMWHFYLQYSRAGFASGYIDDHQMLFTRKDGA